MNSVWFIVLDSDAVTKHAAMERLQTNHTRFFDLSETPNTPDKYFSVIFVSFYFLKPTHNTVCQAHQT